MDQLAPARTECLQYLNQHRDSCLVCGFAQSNRACAVKPNEEISKFKNIWPRSSASVKPKHAVARLDVVHVLQKRHQRSFRGISTGDHFLVL